MPGAPPFTLFANPRAGTPGIVVLPEGGFRRARAEITAWPDYAPTPLRPLPDLARRAGVAAIGWKDEAGRFGLGSFKALGGAYAVLDLLRGALARRGIAAAATAAALADGRYREATRAITVACATDGNHGRAVAWGAARFGCRAVVFLHATVSAAREAAIAGLGAEIRRVPGRYDDAVAAARRTAGEQGWLVVSDTAEAGDTEVPRSIMQGYRLVAVEACEQWAAGPYGGPPTHVLVQAGVGGFAAAVSVQLRASLEPRPALVVVEPDRAACLLASAAAGQATAVPGPLDTIMAGLACAAPSLLAWAELGRSAAAFMAIPDAAAATAMRALAAAGIEAGESGAAGLGALLLAAADPAARAALALGPDSRVLLFGTEAATDPQSYARIVGTSAAADSASFS